MKNRKQMGPLVSAHGVSPVYLQRAAIVAVLSFLFFLVGLMFFYLQQSIAYFILATAFLVVYIFTMIGWVMQKRNSVSIYENGITHGKFAARWDEITSVKADRENGVTILKEGGETLNIGKTTADLPRIADAIRKRLT